MFDKIKIPFTDEDRIIFSTLFNEFSINVQHNEDNIEFKDKDRLYFAVMEKSPDHYTLHVYNDDDDYLGVLVQKNINDIHSSFLLFEPDGFLINDNNIENTIDDDLDFEDLDK